MKDFSTRQKLQIEACTGCFECAAACPAVSSAKDGSLSGIYRLEQLRKILQSQTNVLKWLHGKGVLSQTALEEFADTVYRCTLCGRCQEVCPAGIRLKALWVSLRKNLVCSGASPEKVDAIRDNLSESRNVFDEENDERADWVEDMPDAPDHGHIQDRAEVIYFTGCVSAYFPMARKIPMAVARILTAAEVKFSLLGENEWCCGFPLIGAGLQSHIPEYIRHNIEAVREKKGKTLLFSCPSCYRMWQAHYPQEFQLYHVTEFIEKLIKNKRIPFKPLDMTVTYHDPCDLGRGAGVFDAPRNVLRAVPGVRLAELGRNRNACQCCGGGGNLEMIDAALSSEIAKEKIREIRDTGANTLVTACQQCVRTISTSARRDKIPLEVMDVCEVVARAIAGPGNGTEEM